MNDLDDFLNAKGWGLRKHEDGQITLSNTDGSGVVVREGIAADSIAEALLHRLLDEMLVEMDS